MYGDDFHPILRMAENAVKLQELMESVSDDEKGVIIQGIKASIDAWDKIAQYTEPKLKAVEHTGGTDNSLSVNIMNYAQVDDDYDD